MLIVEQNSESISYLFYIIQYSSLPRPTFGVYTSMNLNTCIDSWKSCHHNWDLLFYSHTVSKPITLGNHQCVSITNFVFSRKSYI